MKAVVRIVRVRLHGPLQASNVSFFFLKGRAE